MPLNSNIWFVLYAKFLKSLSTVFLGIFKLGQYRNCIDYFVKHVILIYILGFVSFQGLQIAHSVYFCGWELMIFQEKKNQSKNNFEKQLKHYNINRLVQMITVRAQRPIVLTGGPFYILSLETFRVVSNILHMANLDVHLRTLLYFILKHQYGIILQIISLAMSNSVMLRTISDTMLDEW